MAAKQYEQHDCRAVKLRESVRFIDTETGKEQIKMMTTGYPVDPVTECVILVSGRRSKSTLFIDQEWDEAECAEEESEYYWLDTRVYRYKDFLAIRNQWLKNGPDYLQTSAISG